MKPTFVILHGWGLSRKKFDPLVEEFKKNGHAAVALDFPGFGENPAPLKPFTLTNYAEFLHEYLTNEHIKDPILIGHSFGGRVSLRYLTLHPKSARALILSGAPGYTPVSRKKLLLFITIAKIGKGVLSLPTLSYVSNFMRKWYYYMVGAREFYRAEGTMRDTFKNVVSEPLVEDMKKISIPTLLLWGEFDTLIPINIGLKMNETIPGSTFKMIQGAGHGVPYKEAAKFVKEIESFVASL